MSFVRIYTIGLLAFGATMTVTLGVVCLIYGIYIDASPKMSEEFPTLAVATAMFFLLTLASAGAFQGLRKQARWLWPAQGALLVVVAGIALVLKKFLLG